MATKEQAGVVKTYTMPYSWTWECTYCDCKNSGESKVCVKCDAKLWEEEPTYEST